MLRRVQIPSDALPGSRALTHRRCGKPSCHCAQAEGHPGWSLTFMVHRKKRVERIPDEWVEQIRPLVEQGRRFKDAVSEVFSANARLEPLSRHHSTPVGPRQRCTVTLSS